MGVNEIVKKNLWWKKTQIKKKCLGKSLVSLKIYSYSKLCILRKRINIHKGFCFYI